MSSTASRRVPVTFEVSRRRRLKSASGEHKFIADFKVGKKAGPDQKKDDGVAEELTVKIQLTLKKT